MSNTDTTNTPDYGPVFRPSWQTLCRDAVLVNLEVSYWRAGNKLDADNLGLSGSPEFVAFAGRWARLGQKKLCPPERIKAISTLSVRARQVLEGMGYKTPWGVMVRKDQYIEMRDRLTALKSDFDAEIARLVADYDDWRDEVRDAYAVQAQTAGTAAEAFGSAVDSTSYVDQILSLIPSPVEIEQKAKFTWFPQEVRAPQVLASGLDVEELEQRADQLRARIESMQEDEQRAIAQAELQTVQNRLAAEEAIHAEMVAHAEDVKKKQIDDLITDVSARVRGLLAEAAINVRKAISKQEDAGAGPQAHGKTLESLRVAIDSVRTLRFEEDADAEAICAELDAWLAQAPEARTKASLAAVMGDVEAVVKADLISLNRPVRTGQKGAIEIPDVEIVAAARQRLGITLPGEEESAAIAAVRKARTA